MKIALDYALLHNPQFPFGALIVDHTKNEISCYGVNSVKENALLHGETAAFWNCTELYPSPTQDDMGNPGLNWTQQTLYTTGEPCPMCAAESIYRRVHRVVWGSSITELNYMASARNAGNQPNPNVPILEGGILKDACDHAFWCAYSVFRNEKYYASMIKNGLEDYIKDHEARFPCDGH
ncbi:hypothetical protein INT47_010735 [Mucor saturninus]|uniref:CMP/dCMP-type deaminase domain-containing protein n=1 Tax=Mucor saturninus TaxID=64648 RepID=A0A8H7R1U2_9FUNG|nr:hypothetical protein INT47_010735 [Mucor saturninus]